MKTKISKILALPRSLILNLILFGWGGVKCPIIISNKARVKGFGRNKIIVGKMDFASVSIGFSGSDGVTKGKTSIIVNDGKIIFKGNCNISSGTSIRVDAGELIFGREFSCNSNCFFSCSRGISFGKNVLLGWNVNVRDSDGHKIIKDGKEKISIKPVEIGNHVWIAAYVDILKGSIIPEGCVIGYRSCVTGAFKNSNTLIAGFPAKEIQSRIEWKY